MLHTIRLFKFPKALSFRIFVRTLSLLPRTFRLAMPTFCCLLMTTYVHVRVHLHVHVHMHIYLNSDSQQFYRPIFGGQPNVVITSVERPGGIIALVPNGTLLCEAGELM